MLTNPSHIKTLFEKYSNREATPAEIRELFQLSLQGSADAELIKLLEDKITHTEIDDYYDKEVWDLVFVKIKDDIAAIEEEVQPKRTKLWPRYIGVAAAVAAIAFGIWFYTSRHPEGSEATRDLLNVAKNDIAPGKNTATLTSSNGSTINLSEAKTGVAIDAAALTYNDGTKIDPSSLGMTNGDSRSLEVITPKGGTYSIILQDGTKVWLNADSKLEFLSNYRNKLQRIVKLTGEGYFEVAKDAKRAFIVQSNGQRVTVLGTHFNVSAYKDEAIRTTLLEGSVSVRHLEGSEATRDLLNSTNKRSLPIGRDDGGGVILKPNQQAILSDQGIKCIQVNPTTAIAWKNGKFAFENEPLSTVMRKVERWYNVTVIFNNPSLKNITFDGSLSRYDNVSRILKSIEFAGKVKFKLEGQKIFVTD